ncbi:acyl-CoA dehydrogenase family protein [Pseudomonas putida]|uniref:acyl-CoA dehydrogenase family protein n=1 Tax=Pseudomonas putida TaxID=303 RepID=UPI0029DE64BA|nr:acyl-CoA dehydrogenase family protein [Pseudomonas putida]WPK03114.1 acyl-CoA dehydrogenase family protein [Pseudomonas putida]
MRESDRLQERAIQIRRFMDQQLIPREACLEAGDAAAHACLAQLQQAAREAGLWGLANGLEPGDLLHYLPLAEQEGRSEHGPAVFGAEAALDGYMLRHGNEQLRQEVLAPVLAGEALASYGMSEPNSIGSIPATLTTRGQWCGDHWRLDGEKWFICRAEQAAFITVVARTREGPLERGLTLFVVPTGTPGLDVVGRMPVLGRYQGQAGVRLCGVRVGPGQVLGEVGGGLALIQERLGLGRLLRSAHWLGMAQRCFDLMGARIVSPRGALARLADKQLVRLRMVEAYQAIHAARSLLRDAATRFDQGQANEVESNLAKLAASRALSLNVDSAIQIHGAEGLGDGLPLAGIYRHARATHFMDGTDDALVSALGRQLIDAYRCAGGLNFAAPSSLPEDWVGATGNDGDRSHAD